MGSPGEATTTLAGLLPVLVGLNATANVQFPAAANVPPQLFAEMTYCVGLAPPRAMDDSVRALLPPLRTVTVVAALVVPTVVRANAMEVGEVVNGLAMAVPESDTVVVLAPPPALTVTVPVLLPALVGLKVMPRA